MTSLDARPPRRLRHVHAVQFWQVRLPPDALALRERGPLEFYVEVHVSVPTTQRPARGAEGATGGVSIHKAHSRQPDFVSAVSRSACSEFALLGGHTAELSSPLDAKCAAVLLCCRNAVGCRRDGDPPVVVASSELDFRAPLCDANSAPLTAPNTLVLRMDDGSMCVTAQPHDQNGGGQGRAVAWHPPSSAQAKLSWSTACSNITRLLRCLADLASARERQQAAQAEAAAAVGAVTSSFGARVAQASHLQHKLDALRTRRYELYRRTSTLEREADAMRGELGHRRAALDASLQRLHGQEVRAWLFSHVPAWMVR
jgi:hypothetical protein